MTDRSITVIMGAVVQRPPTPLVGRQESLRALRAAIRRAVKGSPSVVLLSGETGIGKSRLVRELVAREDVVLLYGACMPVANEPLPFAPLTQALRRLAAAGEVNLQLDRSPDLARLLPDAAGPSDPRTAQTTDAGETGEVGEAGAVGPASQLRLFQSVLLLLERLGARVPVLLVVEDVHWADRATLDLIRYLATNLTSERAVVLVSHRVDVVVAGTPLASWLAELGRLEVTVRVALERLTPQETADLVGQLAGHDASPDVVEATLRRSAGNPLFAEHLVLQGAVSGELPATLGELLDGRVRELPASTRPVLEAAAVLGRPVSVDLLAATSGVPVEELEERLLPAIDQHVMQLRRDDLLAFHHPAFGEVVRAGLLPGRRSRLHRAAAVALEATAGAAQPGELARHWLGAGDVPRALDAAVTAGAAAERMYAFADAHANFTRAIRLLDEVPDTPHDRVALLERAAQAASLVGDGDEAVRLVEAAIEHTIDPVSRAALLARLGGIHYLAGRGPRAEKCFRAALALLPAAQESVLMARILAGLALVGAAWSRLCDADEASERGLAVARATGARREEGIVLNAMGVVACARGDVEEAVDHVGRALAIAQELGNPNDLATAYINLTHVLAVAGRVDEVVRIGAEGSAALTRVGLARQSGSFLKTNIALALVESGRLDEAGAVIEEALTHHPRGITVAPVLTQAARIDLVHGHLDRAWERLAQARAVIESENAPDAWLRAVIELAAEVELWNGHGRAAYELVVDGLTLAEGTEEEGSALVLVALGFRALATEAEAHRDAASRRRLADDRRILDRASGWSWHEQPESASLDAWRRAETARLEGRNDPAAWADVVAAWTAISRPFPAAYARWRESEARLDIGRDAAAVASVRAAHEAATALGATRLVEEIIRLAGWHRIDLALDAGPATDASPTALDAYSLTGREREVLGGLAAGKTNQEIADELFISVKTASVHVSNILRKLEVSGRHEAARVAHRLGVRT
ncbi:MAG: AAA family ATPase [Lapillicoccus sp.]